ncbi:MAG: inositol monophosphatase family protein [Myxococcota bacterium]
MTSDHLAAALAAVDAAGVGLRTLFRSGVRAEQKEASSPIVTEADRASERAIRAVLEDRTPDVGILGEELPTVRPEAPMRWIIDPIDGTIAFACGKATFTTLLALTDHARPVLGIVDQPILEERWVGTSEGTTFICGPTETRCATRTGISLAQARMASTSPAFFKGRERVLERLTDAVHVVSWGGDAYNVGLLALGHLDLIVETGLEPYDYAPWAPIVRGAGGRVTDWAGRDLDRVDGRADVVACGDPALLDAVLPLLQSEAATHAP